jgi:hypothetical protein
MATRFTSFCLVGLIAVTGPAAAQPEGDGEALSLEEVSRKLDNPLSDLWMIFVENDLSRFRGKPADGSKWVNTAIVQPVMPLALTEKWNLVSRPIIPIVTAPKFERPDSVPRRSFEGFNQCPGNCLSQDPRDVFPGITPSTDRKTELGDIVFWSMVSPADPPELPDGSKFVWGIGPSFMFPTATEDQFGSEKWSMGPSAITLRLPPPGGKVTAGLFQQHLFSYGGSGDDDVRMSQFQPIYWYKLPWGQWQVGGFPMITVNWEADSDNKLTLPIELAVSNTFFVGPMPMRIGIGMNYSVVAPDDYGQRWMIKFFIVPVIPKPIKRPLFGEG